MNYFLIPETLKMDIEERLNELLHITENLLYRRFTEEELAKELKGIEGLITSMNDCMTSNRRNDG